MNYSKIKKGIFLSRSNRFVARVLIDGEETVCHIKNTGRLTELLKSGAVAYLEESENPERKTKFDLVAVEKDGEIFNIDSYAPNLAAGEYFRRIFPDAQVRAEVKYGGSRFDFYIENENRKIFAEVKGVTLIKDGVALFPDAPTERGIKHINELVNCLDEGYEAQLLFVVQTRCADSFSPNDETHMQFGEALRLAEKAGVKIMAVNCIVTPDSMIIENTLPTALRRIKK